MDSRDKITRIGTLFANESRDTTSAATGIKLYDIYPLQMMITTNIPNKTPFMLKSSAFILGPRPKYAIPKPAYAELPFFTNEYEYPIMYLSKMEPHDVMDFFFAREIFELKLRKYILKSGGQGNTNKELNSKRNATYMLQLLFKTVYPRINNISRSYYELINRNASPNINFNILSNFIPQYTYLREDAKAYTVLRAVLLDDIFNHPVYQSLFNAYYEYYMWCNKEKNRIDREYTNNNKKINTIIKKYNNYDNDIQLIENRIQNIERSNTSGTRVYYEELTKISDLKTLLGMFKNLKKYREWIGLSKASAPAATATSTGPEGSEERRDTDVSRTTEIQKEMNDILYESRVNREKPIHIDRRNYADFFKKEMGSNTIYEFKDRMGFWYKIRLTDRITTPKNMMTVFLVNLEGRSTNLSITIYITDQGIDLYKNSGKFNDYLNSDTDKYVAEKIETDVTKDSKKSFVLINTTTAATIINKVMVKYSNDTEDSGYSKIDPKTQFLLKEDADKFGGSYVSTQPYDKSDQSDQSNRDIVRIKELTTVPVDSTKDRVNKTPDSILYDSILELIQPIFTASGIRFDRNTTIFINALTQVYNVGKDSRILSEKYLENRNIDVNVPMEKYTGYTTFINVVKKFLTPERNTSNPVLQELIDNYANNQVASDTLDKTEFVTLANAIYGCFDKFNPTCDILKNAEQRDVIESFAETGVSEININRGNDHKYELYVHLDVVEGQLNASNTKLISCAYQDSVLTDRFEIMTNRKKQGSWILLPAPFVAIPSDGKPLALEKGSTSRTTQKSEPGASQGGSRKKRRTRKNRVQFRRIM